MSLMTSTVIHKIFDIQPLGNPNVTYPLDLISRTDAEEELAELRWINDGYPDLSLGWMPKYGHVFVNSGNGTPTCKKCGLVYSPKWFAEGSKVGCYMNR